MKSYYLIISLSVFVITLAVAQRGKENAITKSENYKNGKEVYNKVCLSCHMEDGAGVPHLNPPLIKTSYVSGNKTKLIQIVLKGMNERVKIEDESYSNVMASHADLSDQQIADVLTYIRNSFGNKYGIVTATEVKAARELK